MSDIEKKGETRRDRQAGESSEWHPIFRRPFIRANMASIETEIKEQVNDQHSRTTATKGETGKGWGNLQVRTQQQKQKKKQKVLIRLWSDVDVP